MPRESSDDLTFRYVRLPDRLYTFKTRLLEATPDTIVLAHQAHPSTPLYLDGEEVMGDGYDVVWFLFKGEPFDIGRFYRPDGEWTGYYVDMLEPVQWDGDRADTLEPIVDLILDLWIDKEGHYTLLDRDEFDQALSHRWISDEQARQAQQTLEALVESIEAGRFPPRYVRDWSNGPSTGPDPWVRGRPRS